MEDPIMFFAAKFVAFNVAVGLMALGITGISAGIHNGNAKGALEGWIIFLVGANFAWLFVYLIMRS